MMDEVNFNMVLLDLASGGVDRTSPEDIKTIADYAKPLTDYLASINFKQLATLVAHDVLTYNFNEKGVATSISINTTVAADYLFKRTPFEDKILAKTLLNDSPYTILNEVMHLTSQNYGSIKRFYVTTYMDQFFPAEIQKHIYTRNPPRAKFILKNGDHASFFSETPYLFHILREIANV
ncbi:hypothetical protein R1flu_012104 [Riccia fluitans]|uniref:Uncharacterized protein n=1 Tax=Riccia fluitans TaxID=41844 RepID=A0ABD1Z9N6_9MARC